VLYSAEEAFYQVAIFVKVLIETTLDNTIAFGRDNDRPERGARFRCRRRGTEMNRRPPMAIATLLNHDARRRTGGLLVHVHPGHQQEFAALVDSIWIDLKSRFAVPFTVKESARRRSATVLGTFRYVVSRKDGRLTLDQKPLSALTMLKSKLGLCSPMFCLTCRKTPQRRAPGG
jgi:hypothetical protein